MTDMRALIILIENADAPEVVSNPIKAKLAKELTKARSVKDADYNVPGFRQKAHGLNLAKAKQDWAVRWRSEALEDLPDSVASVEKVVANMGRSQRDFKFLVFRDGDGSPLLAVQPAMSNSINSYEILNGRELVDVLGKYWKVRTVG